TDGKFRDDEVSIRRCKARGAALLSQDEVLAQVDIVEAGIVRRAERILPVEEGRDIPACDRQIAPRWNSRGKPILKCNAAEALIRVAEEGAILLLRHKTHRGAEVGSEATEPGDRPILVGGKGGVSASVSTAAIGANDELTSVLCHGAL